MRNQPADLRNLCRGRLTVAEQVLLSVITIAKDNLVGLRQTRESVTIQTHLPLEHIVVDGGSSDGTPEWLASQRLTHWLSETDRGRYDAMNKGADLAQGRLLWFLHAGDTFASAGSAEAVVMDWQARGWEWAYGCARLVSSGSELIGVNAPIPFRTRLFELGKLVVPHQAACFEKQLFQRLGGYNVDFGVAADQLFMLRAAQESLPATIPEFLCDFDVEGAGSRRSPYRHYWDAARARRAVGIRSSRGAATIDAALALALSTSEVAKRFLGKQIGNPS